jgi:hypothetical protein
MAQNDRDKGIVNDQSGHSYDQSISGSSLSVSLRQNILVKNLFPDQINQEQVSEMKR